MNEEGAVMAHLPTLALMLAACCGISGACAVGAATDASNSRRVLRSVNEARAAYPAARAAPTSRPDAPSAAVAGTTADPARAAARRSGLSRLLDRETRFVDQKRVADTLAALALAGVREESRGFVITLPASILFRVEEDSLSYEAQSRLDPVIEALRLDSGERVILVNAHTDSRGSEQRKTLVSQRWADAVRDYLVQRGHSPGRVQAMGMGRAHPIADNRRRGGRAKNRRVEIIIERNGE